MVLIGAAAAAPVAADTDVNAPSQLRELAQSANPSDYDHYIDAATLEKGGTLTLEGDVFVDGNIPQGFTLIVEASPGQGTLVVNGHAGDNTELSAKTIELAGYTGENSHLQSQSFDGMRIGFVGPGTTVDSTYESVSGDRVNAGDLDIGAVLPSDPAQFNPAYITGDQVTIETSLGAYAHVQAYDDVTVGGLVGNFVRIDTAHERITGGIDTADVSVGGVQAAAGDAMPVIIADDFTVADGSYGYANLDGVETQGRHSTGLAEPPDAAPQATRSPDDMTAQQRAVDADGDGRFSIDEYEQFLQDKGIDTDGFKP